MINMVGMLQSNRTGDEVKDVREAMKKGTYESVQFQHKDNLLSFSLWLDNSVVKMLSNFHSPIVCSKKDGVLQKKRGEDGRRKEHRTEVLCPQQNKDDIKTFHLIGNVNGVEAN